MLASAALHEAGHIFSALASGAKVLRFDVELWGGKLIYGGSLSYLSEALIALAGIAVNLVAFSVSLLFFKDSDYGLFFSFCNLAYALINLLPIKTLDGFVALNAILCAVTKQEKADSALRGLNSAFVLLLCAALCLLVKLSGFNSSVLFLAVLTVSLLLERN